MDEAHPQAQAERRIRAFLESLGPNEGYAEELYQVFLSNPQAVSGTWREIFQAILRETGPVTANGHHHAATPAVSGAAESAPVTGFAPVSAPVPSTDDTVQPLLGAAGRIALNMQASLAIPLASSQRAVPMRLSEENRRFLNSQLAAAKRKVSLTHLLAWAAVRALEKHPALNRAFTLQEGKPARLERAHIHLGFAVDVETRGGRGLLVPVLKRAEQLSFLDFLAAADRLIQGARSGQLSPDDLQGATFSLTNPGTLGTRASSPRLMAGQGAILAAGALDYPSGFEGLPEQALHSLGIGKTITLTCAYDHRVIQGAESGAFLGYLHALLLGEYGFYERIFHEAQVPYKPASWTRDAAPGLMTAGIASGELESARKQASVFQLAHAYRVRGHLLAQLDPLGPQEAEHPELDPDHYGLSLWDLDRRFLSPLYHSAGEPELHTLREILELARATYCGTLACEYMHIQKMECRRWLQARLEPTRAHWPLPEPIRRRILDRLTAAEGFERLLHARYIGHKRFSLEGAESLIPALDHLLNLAGAAGAKEIAIGMAHRGRLNVLVNIVGKAMTEIVSKFEDMDPESVAGSGDVKYHIGAEGQVKTPDGHQLRVTVSPNPSHLEAVDPVLEGSARARQELLGDHQGRLVLPVLIHGDAAFAGQGVVAETLNLSQLAGYEVGGTVHLVVNNRIGFTTSPAAARSSLYCTDVARMVQAPIFHVNADDPEAVLRAIELSFGFRSEFQSDVVIDLVCYRRHGHNEADDPSLTHPDLYRRIERHPGTRAIYARQLVETGLLAVEDEAALQKQVRERLSAPAAAHDEVPPRAPRAHAVDTEVPLERLRQIGAALGSLPSDFHPHPKLKTFFERRGQMLAGSHGVDWSLAEALAFGSLLQDSVPIRITGQDTGRGTFSQRHAVLYDYDNGATYTPLQHVPGATTGFMLHDSLLSEEAALGFEFGYSMEHPRALVIWEAQFGDFANGAEVVIDQFLAPARAKWGRTSGLTLFLPHGYEGQGPEHSSARPERFLQLCAEDNLQVVNCTTAAQYFHLLRRQGLRGAAALEARRPLILLTPKSLLRHPEVASPLSAFAGGRFHPLLPDPNLAPESAQRIILCNGKIFYELLAARRERGDGALAAAALIRVEQLYPFPAREIETALAACRRANEFFWVQEEPENMGAWSYIAPRLQALEPRRHWKYIGRDPAASSATGSLRRHQREQKAVIARALGLEESAAGH